MVNTSTRIGRMLAAAAMAFNAVQPASATPLDCIADWAEASKIVESENLAPVAALTDAAKTSEDSQVVRTVLCRSSGAYVYRVVLKDRTGRLRTETVNARRPFGLSFK